MINTKLLNNFFYIFYYKCIGTVLITSPFPSLPFPPPILLHRARPALDLTDLLIFFSLCNFLRSNNLLVPSVYCLLHRGIKIN